MSTFNVIKQFVELEEEFNKIDKHAAKREYYVDLSNKVILHEGLVSIANKIIEQNYKLFNIITNYLENLLILSNKIDPVWYIYEHGKKKYTIKHGSLYPYRMRSPIPLKENIFNIQNIKVTNSIQQEVVDMIASILTQDIYYDKKYINNKFYKINELHLIFDSYNIQLQDSFRYNKMLYFSAVYFLKDLYEYHKLWNENNVVDTLKEGIAILKQDNLLLQVLAVKSIQDNEKYKLINQL